MPRSVVAVQPTRRSVRLSGRVVVVCSGAELTKRLGRALGRGVELVRVRSPRGPKARAAVASPLSALVLDGRGIFDRGALAMLAAHSRHHNPDASIFVISFEKSVELPGAGPVRTVSPVALVASLSSHLGAPLLREKPAPSSGEADPMDRWIDLTTVTWGGRYDLTAGECAVVRHAVRGRSNKEIAAGLGITVATVRTHLINICRKVRIASRGELIFRFFGESWALVADERQPRGADRHVAAGSAPRVPRWRVLFVSENSFLRGLALTSLDEAGTVEPIVLHRQGAREVVQLGLILHGVVIDQDTVADVPEFIDMIREHELRPAIFILSSDNEASALARRLGAGFLKAPFLPNDFARTLERRLAQTWPGF